MISLEQFEELKKHEVNSWALWDENGLGDEAFFKENIDKLHFNVIFLGLNPSKSIHNPEDEKIKEFTNFHTPGKRGDKILHNYIQKNNLKNLIGSFMTDLITVRESNSNKVIIDPKSLNYFVNTVKSLLGIKEGNIVCFGNESYKNIKESFKNNFETTYPNNIKSFKAQIEGKSITFYKVWHYSPRGYNNKNVAELETQLSFLNSILH